jgi:antitoxin component of RelBE/YafQ-DinJ toxin-antitoxin module
MKNLNKIKMLTVRIDSDLNEKFQKHCKKNGYSISKRIRILLENDINGN